MREQNIKLNFNENFNISKIIHQTAPADKKKWHPIWEHCQKTWKDCFPEPEYKYIFWDDDNLFELIKNDFPDFLELYNDFGRYVILKVDFARYAILYKYGGIYSDMDFMCKKNFYNQLQNNICIVESPAPNETIQNSLMASPPNDKRWLDVLQNCKDYYYDFIKKNPNTSPTENRGQHVIDITGPRLLSRAFDIKSIHILPKNLYNPYKNAFNSKDIFTKHYGTGKWGPQAGIAQFKDLRNTDKDLYDIYNGINMNKNFNLQNIPEGYLVLECGISVFKKKTINLNIPLNKCHKILLAEHSYQDIIIFNYDYNSQKIILERTDAKCGWGHNHHVYFTGNNVENFELNQEIKNFTLEDTLQVYDLEMEKIRLGKNNDGGYCILPQDNYDLLISGGVSYDISFEEDFLLKYPNIMCEAFDGSVSSLPKQNKRINFNKKFIGKNNTETETNLHDLINKYNDIFLKMDIEGGEYSFFNSLNDIQMLKLKQIVVEIHWPDTLDRWDILRKISKTHYLIHVHGNNFQKKIQVKDFENGYMKMKIQPSSTNIKEVKLLIPLCKNTHFKILNNTLNHKFKFEINDSNNILIIERIDKNEGWSNTFWISVNKYNIEQTNSNIEIPKVFECTYVRKRDFDFIPKLNEKSLPSNIDMPNNRARPDINLNYWPFVNN